MEEKAEMNASKTHLSAERDKLKRRQQEISTLLFKLFEDHAAGLISNENYVSFTNRYQSKQAEILQKLSVLGSRMEQQNDYHANAEKLREVTCDFLNVEKLTPHMLNKLIERIEIGHTEVVDEGKRQEIDRESAKTEFYITSSSSIYHTCASNLVLKHLHQTNCMQCILL